MFQSDNAEPAETFTVPVMPNAPEVDVFPALSSLADLMNALGAPDGLDLLLARAVSLAGIALVAIGAHYLAKFIIHRIIMGVARRMRTGLDQALLRHKIFDRLAQFAPAFLIWALAPQALDGLPGLTSLVVTATFIYMVVIGVLFLDTVLNAALEIYNSFPMARQMPIRSFVQVAKLIIYLAGLIWIMSLLLGENPMKFIAGLGAATAILMLVFKDPILGFVAGIQLSSNKMVAIGDWITMEQYGLDGDVEDITLTTVKVRNFDKTITTVPTQALINESFRNWRGMKETGGRRIKRSIHVDMSTIRFLTEEDIERFTHVRHLTKYMQAKQDEFETYVKDYGSDAALAIGGRRMTNIGTFRAWIDAFLRDHPMVRTDYTFMIRQLEPEAQGLPIEVYAFTTIVPLIEFERVQSDIFDHVLAAAPEFGLRVYQQPSGADLAALGAGMRAPASTENPALPQN